MFKLVLAKTEEPEIKLLTSTGSWKKQESSRRSIYFCFIDYAFDCVDHKRTVENSFSFLINLLHVPNPEEMGIPDHLTFLLRNLYAGQKATVRTGHETTDWFQIGKAVYCHPAYLTYMQSSS